MSADAILPKLKPCPFCGGEARAYNSVIPEYEYDMPTRKLKTTLHRVECQNCGINGQNFYGKTVPWKTMRDLHRPNRHEAMRAAKDAWNTRPAPALSGDVGEAMAFFKGCVAHTLLTEGIDAAIDAKQYLTTIESALSGLREKAELGDAIMEGWKLALRDNGSVRIELRQEQAPAFYANIETVTDEPVSEDEENFIHGYLFQANGSGQSLVEAIKEAVRKAGEGKNA